MAGTAELRWSIKELSKHLDQSNPNASKVLAAIRSDPTSIFTLMGMAPDRWQRQVLTDLASVSRRLLCLLGRQTGKSTVAAIMAVATALLEPALVLLLSPSQRQSGELFRKVIETYTAIGYPLPATSETRTTTRSSSEL